MGRKENVSKIAAGRGEARPGGARLGQAGRGKDKQGEVTSSIQRVYCWMHWRKLQPGAAWQGMARLGPARHGKAKRGKVDSKHPAISVVGWNGGNSNAAGHGAARLGGAKQGKAII